ncbi:hypothetical protein A0J61_09569 [Choanephora cucurbitarum]|uniref:Uncharacterized protein n=1 Tax=Choanephora cucurbitarum TaxID=101091 RepID=A0A1C7MZT2_9FUNG|nr:hypothetical protein A0J61_09569 [Choanephora cucurbitarum]
MPMGVQFEMKGNFDGLSISGSSLKTHTNNMTGVSSITSKEPITYNQYPYEPMDELKTAWISIMQLLNEAKMPRKYQRQLVSVLNNQVLSHVREAKTKKRN